MGSYYNKKYDTFAQMQGQRVTLFCANYVYSGLLANATATHLTLEDAVIVFETGDLESAGWDDAQPLPTPWRVQISAVESWGVLNKSMEST
jgi:hypothetical protein